MRTFWQKITSRKFLACLIGVVVGLATAFGLDESIITTVSGAVVTLVSLVTYIITEGKVDAAAVKQAVEQIQEAAETVKEA